jgi:hypothetical protein
MSKPPKQRLTFSHKLALSFVSMYVVVMGVVTIMWVLRGAEGRFLIDAISLPVMTIVTGYFAKAGVENWNKYKQDDCEDVDYNDQV